uniref:Uncharacterized protein LOC104232130 n=1 Tax=Nicotiana sylvestris TaxID=4096 RepID=A0A1U7X1K4_NICSY|nr:PREDICTED: uncharacterized protein LOC104232130 [Nicotiana sylvestris]
MTPYDSDATKPTIEKLERIVLIKHLPNRKETFNILRKYNMKLNPEKCIFGVGSGKFLSIIVSNRGIEINLNKIKMIEDIAVVENIKAVQRLIGRIAALGRFISRSSDRSHRFFSLLKKKNNFAWTQECQQALEELKRYLSILPLLHTPKADEQLCLYLSVSEVAVSCVLVREEQVSSRRRPRQNKLQSLTWDWRNKYIEYLKNGKLPSDPKELKILRTKVARFTLAEDGTLYRRMFDGPLGICLGLGDTDYVLRKIHEGTCGNHSGAESLVHKVIRAGYYWPIWKKILRSSFENATNAKDMHR